MLTGYIYTSRQSSTLFISSIQLYNGNSDALYPKNKWVGPGNLTIHTLQTNPWHREEETQITNSRLAPRRQYQSKATSPLFFREMIAKLDKATKFSFYWSAEFFPALISSKKYTVTMDVFMETCLETGR